MAFFFSEIIEENSDIHFTDVLFKLMSLNIEGLPPGGGLAAK